MILNFKRRVPFVLSQEIKQKVLHCLLAMFDFFKQVGAGDEGGRVWHQHIYFISSSTYLLYLKWRD